MKKLLILIVPALFLFSCKQDPGEIQGLVTHQIWDTTSDTYTLKPSTGAEVYVSKLKDDSLGLYFKADSVVTHEDNFHFYGTGECLNTEIQKRILSIKKLRKDIWNPNYYRDIDLKEFEIPMYQDELDSHLYYINELLSKFKNEADYVRFMEVHNKLIQNMKTSQDTYKTQADVNGKYEIKQIEPGDYTVIIFSASSREDKKHKIEKVHVDSKKTVVVNAKFE